MTPNEEIALKLVKDGNHTVYQIIKAQNMPNASNFMHILDKMCRDGILQKGYCPSCDKKGYYSLNI